MISCPCYKCEKRNQTCRLECYEWKEYEAKVKEDKEKLREYKMKYMYNAKASNQSNYLKGSKGRGRNHES